MLASLPKYKSSNQMLQWSMHSWDLNDFTTMGVCGGVHRLNMCPTLKSSIVTTHTVVATSHIQMPQHIKTCHFTMWSYNLEQMWLFQHIIINNVFALYIIMPFPKLELARVSPQAEEVVLILLLWIKSGMH